jgi:PEGA domain.
MMLRSVIGTLSTLMLCGCATIIHGGSQDIGFSSTPSAAKVTIDNNPVGQTPVVAHISRKDNHIVRMELAGYQPFEATLTRGTSGWVWGNLVFGGIPGLAIDAISGGLYKLTPEQIAAQLARQGASIEKSDDTIYIGVVLQPDPEWERVGTLTRE